MYQNNNKIVIEQGDLCWFRDSKGNLKQGNYWYLDSGGLIFHGIDGTIYTNCSFVKNCENK